MLDANQIDISCRLIASVSGSLPTRKRRPRLIAPQGYSRSHRNRSLHACNAANDPVVRLAPSTVNRKRGTIEPALSFSPFYTFAHRVCRPSGKCFLHVVVFENVDALKSGTATVRSKTNDVPTKSECAGCNGITRGNAEMTMVARLSAVDQRSDLIRNH